MGFHKAVMNQSYAPKATNRVIVITVCLSEAITSDEEAYRTLVTALTNMHLTPGLLEDQDFVCYNIGSPMLKSLLKSDLQKHMPDFDEAYREHSLFNEQLREESTTFKVLQKGAQFNVGVIESDTKELKTIISAQNLMMKPYFISRMIVHATWAVIQTYILYMVLSENFCLVKWAYTKPFMVLPQGSD